MQSERREAQSQCRRGTISKNQVKRFSSLAELKLLDFTHKDTTGGYYKKEEKKNIIEYKRDVLFCQRTFQGAAESRVDFLFCFFLQETESKSLNSLIAAPHYSTLKGQYEYYVSVPYCVIVW